MPCLAFIWGVHFVRWFDEQEPGVGTSALTATVTDTALTKRRAVR